jgi:hypothetical protein
LQDRLQHLQRQAVDGWLLHLQLEHSCCSQSV